MDYILLANFDTVATGTRLQSYTPDEGPVGTEENGTWETCYNNPNYGCQIYGSGPGGPAWIVVWQANQYNVTISVNFCFSATTSSASYNGICFRYTNNSNFWMACILSYNSTYALYERNSGTFTSRASGNYSGGTFSANTNYAIEAVLSGNTINFYVGGTLQCTYTNLGTTNPTATLHGLRWNTGDTSFFNAPLTIKPT